MTRRLLILYAFLLPYEGLWIALFNSNTIFKPYRIVGLALLASVVLRRAFGRGRPLRFDGYDTGFGLLISGGLAMAFVWYIVAGTANLAWAVNETILLSFVYLMFIVIKNEVESIRDVEQMMVAVVAGTISSVLVSNVFGVSLDDAVREHAYLKNPNSLGIFAGASIIILLGRLIYGRFKSVLVGYIVTGLLSLYLVPVLLSTGSRSPLVAIAVAMVGLIFPVALLRSGNQSKAAGRLMAVLPLIVLAGAVGALLIATREEGSPLARLSIEQSSSGSGRFDIWRAAWRVAQEHYFLGVGVGQYRLYHRSYVELIGRLYSPGVYKSELGTHSDYVNLLTCYGFPLMSLYLAMMVNLYRRTVKRLGEVAGAEPGFARPTMLALLLFILLNQVGHNMMQGPAYFLVMAFAVWLATHGGSRRQSLGRS